MDLDELAEKDYIVILDGYTDEPSIFGENKIKNAIKIKLE